MTDDSYLRIWGWGRPAVEGYEVLTLLDKVTGEWRSLLVDSYHLDRAVSRDDAIDWGYQHLTHEFEEAALPGCVVPGCVGRGCCQVFTAEAGRFAGRDWQPGDEVHLCPQHHSEVLMVEGIYEIDQLPEWMRADVIHNRQTRVMDVRRAVA